MAEAVLSGRTLLQQSQNDYDWLGNGIYFWEHNAQRAFDFACQLKNHNRQQADVIRKPSVVGAVINLGYCLNLLDHRYIELVGLAYRDLKAAAKATKTMLPVNSGGQDLLRRARDCAVLNFLHAQRANNGEPAFDTVRAAFVEGKPLYPNAGFRRKNHIQIAVRNTRSILGYFRPLDEQGQPMAFAS